MASFKQGSEASTRLQKASQQYESLLIRAGEIMEHINQDSDRENSFDGGNSGGSYSKSRTHHHPSPPSHGYNDDPQHSGMHTTGFPNMRQFQMQQQQQYSTFSSSSGSNYTSPNTNSGTFSGPRGSGPDSGRPHTGSHSHSHNLSMHKVDSLQYLPNYGHDVDVVDVGNGEGLGDNEISEDDKTTIILTLQAEVNRLKSKLEVALTSAEETVSYLYQAHSAAESDHQARQSSLSADNERLRDENLLLKSKLRSAQSHLVTERENLLRATHLIHRLHSRQKIVTHGLLPSKSKRHYISTTSTSSSAAMSSSGAHRSSTGRSSTASLIKSPVSPGSGSPRFAWPGTSSPSSLLSPHSVSKLHGRHHAGGHVHVHKSAVSAGGSGAAAAARKAIAAGGHHGVRKSNSATFST